MDGRQTCVAVGWRDVIVRMRQGGGRSEREKETKERHQRKERPVREEEMKKGRKLENERGKRRER